MDDNNEILKVSVVIPSARDAYKDTVKSLEGQDCEVVVAHDKTQGASVNKNQGLKRANNNLICFLDDDVIVHPHYIQDIKDEFKKTGADIIGGVVMPWGRVARWFPYELHSMLAINPVSEEIYGCNLAVKKEVFEKLNFSFSEKLDRKKGKNLIVGEDSELFFLAKKNGMKIHKSDKAIVYHLVNDERRSYRYFTKRVFWEGRSEVKRSMFMRHFILGLASVCLSLIRWFIYATSFFIYVYGALVELAKGKVSIKAKKE